ncbi:cysteine-rich CWC family protein [Vibrio gangliei]|uniref:cysteine-rich CWC family protein n=1 Tax=Vibrio gangliei TaxID=2077090 RepID=UPI000D01AB62|nr:cysteine-rich CWC family protein [Vibrio gangliei]
MKTPCIAACKNNGGICSGCHRTMDEILQWRHLDDVEHQQVIDKLQGAQHTHACPECGNNSFCDLAAGKKTCWCFHVEEREITQQHDTCLCRACLEKQPIR